MIYPKDFEEKVGFDQIRTMLNNYCLSDLGTEYIQKVRFSSQYKLVDKLLNQASEFKRILEEKPPFPADNYFNLLPELNRIKPEGTFISLEQLFDLKSSLETIFTVLEYINNLEKEVFSNIIALTQNIDPDPHLLKELNRILNNKGELKDKASPKLSEIRKSINDKRSSIDQKIRKTLQLAKKSGWVKEDVEIAFREGRLVIPIAATHKNKVHGFIHDYSATGQTAFVEPAEVFETNNEIKILEGDEKQEIVRILQTFTLKLRPDIDELAKAYEFLGLIDFIRAKAKLAIRLDGIKPELTHSQDVLYNNAVHPLLVEALKKSQKKVVPLDIILNKKQRILIISGPNAGGKSVTLKTIGLLQYMLQCGLLIPVKEGTKSGLFENFFIDIGDEQSLENDLSTYSSHLINMKHFSLHANDKTLFLIDEFGTGTEPRIGGAIAEAILENLYQKDAYGVLTTHYANLKLLAKEDNNISNAAMLYDAEAMQPLYQLRIGKPGSSFAFEIAKKIGFPKKILHTAKQKTDQKQLNFDEQLQVIEDEKRKLLEDRKKFEMANDFLNELVEKFEKENSEIRLKKENILQQAYHQAEEVLQRSNKLIERTIKEIKEAQADKAKTKKIREKIEKEKKKIKIEIIKPKPEKKKEIQPKEETEKPIKIGDYVQFIDQDFCGEVISIKGEDIIINFNSVSLKTSLEKVQKISKKEIKRKNSQKGNTRFLSDIQEKRNQFKFQIDVRGKRGEEALTLIRHYLDDAFLLRVAEVRILHGKGFGILREIIHDFLKIVPEVRTYKDEHIERGGSGITVVHIKRD